MCAQSCLTLCDPMDCNLPGSSVHGIFQARILEWLPFPPPGDLPNPGIEPRSLTSAGGFFTTWATREAQRCVSVRLLQLCLTLCDPMDYSPLGSSVHGILQARTLEWVAIPFSRESSQPRGWTWVSCIAGRFFTIWARVDDGQGGLARCEGRAKPKFRVTDGN